ncbi:MAG: hypothetical protein R2932_59975 [Caldilineaceae bacterium]
MKNNNLERGTLANFILMRCREAEGLGAEGQHLLSQPRLESINLTITELGTRVGVSDASIVCFAQALAIPVFTRSNWGWPKIWSQLMWLVHEDVKADDVPASAVQKAMTGMRSLEDTARILELPVLEAAITALCNAQQIELLPPATRSRMALDLTFRLTKLGYAAASPSTPRSRRCTPVWPRRPMSL